MWRQRVARLAATMWVGSQWTIGFLVAPILFNTLNDNALAGSIAGSMFRAEAWVSLVCGVLLWWLRPAQRKLVLALLVCTLIGYFGLHSFLAESKASGDKSLFALLHGLSSLIYAIQSIAALYLIDRPFAESESKAS